MIHIILQTNSTQLQFKSVYFMIFSVLQYYKSKLQYQSPSYLDFIQYIEQICNSKPSVSLRMYQSRTSYQISFALRKIGKISFSIKIAQFHAFSDNETSIKLQKAFHLSLQRIFCDFPRIFQFISFSRRRFH